jgi:hypothetical protein
MLTKDGFGKRESVFVPTLFGLLLDVLAEGFVQAAGLGELIDRVTLFLMRSVTIVLKTLNLCFLGKLFDFDLASERLFFSSRILSNHSDP